MSAKTYTIRTLADIYNLPTFDQVRIAAMEIAEIIISARIKNDLMAELAAGRGIECPAGRAFFFPESIEWIDDGRAEARLTFTDHENRHVGKLEWQMGEGVE